MRRMLLFACAAALVAVLIGTALSSPGNRSGPRTPPQAEVPSDGPFALAASGVQEAKPGPPEPGAAATYPDHRDHARGATAYGGPVSGHRDGRRGYRGHRGHDGGRHAMRERLISDLADRLEVERPALRTALGRVHDDVAKRGDDPRRMSPAEWRTLKADVLSGLGEELDLPASRVGAAVRAELAQKLDLAVTFGAVTAHGRRLALDCYDAPDRCDVAALKGEARFGRSGR